MKTACRISSLVRLPEALPAYSPTFSAYAADFLISASSFHRRSSPSCRPCPSHDLPGVTLPHPTWRLLRRSLACLPPMSVTKKSVPPPVKASRVKILQSLGRLSAGRVTNAPVRIIAQPAATTKGALSRTASDVRLKHRWENWEGSPGGTLQVNPPAPSRCKGAAQAPKQRCST